MTTFPTREPFAAPNGTLAPQLIGQWLTSESRISSGFSSLIEMSITFLANGRALEFEGRTQSTHATPYYWAVEGPQLFFGHRPNQYRAAGTYVVEGDSLFITHLDGNRVFWQRTG